MSSGKSPDARDADPAFDMALEPSPKTPVIEGEADDEETQRKRDAALASTFDQELAHAGKSDEELIAERDAETRALIDVAIVAGVLIAAADADADETEETNPADVIEDGGE